MVEGSLAPKFAKGAFELVFRPSGPAETISSVLQALQTSKLHT